MNDETPREAFNTVAEVRLAELSLLQATQLKFGFIEIEEKCKRFAGWDKEKLEKYLIKNPIIVVLGPPGIRDTGPFPRLTKVARQIKSGLRCKHEDAGKDAPSLFVIDRHHQALALLLDGFKTAPIEVTHDFSGLSEKEFWAKMKSENLLYPNDAVEPPESHDDIFRSLAWYVRKAGGFEKVETPYAEFAWAKYFSKHLNEKFVAENFEQAIQQALTLTKRAEARDLPGYISAPQRSGIKGVLKKASKLG